MDLRLQGKRALVTGSRNGLGEAIARALAAMMKRDESAEFPANAYSAVEENILQLLPSYRE